MPEVQKLFMEQTKMNRYVAPLLAAAILLSGCAAPRALSEYPGFQSRYVASEHTAYLADGKHTVTGQAFLRQKGGGVVTCAGYPVVLAPATPFFTELLPYAAANKVPETVGTEYRKVVKRSQCDAQGNFVFNNVPPGRWHILTAVEWVVAGNNQGAVVKREITVPTEQVILSDLDRTWAH